MPANGIKKLPLLYWYAHDVTLFKKIKLQFHINGPSTANSRFSSDSNLTWLCSLLGLRIPVWDQGCELLTTNDVYAGHFLLCTSYIMQCKPWWCSEDFLVVPRFSYIGSIIFASAFRMYFPKQFLRSEHLVEVTLLRISHIFIVALNQPWRKSKSTVSNSN